MYTNIPWRIIIYFRYCESFKVSEKTQQYRDDEYLKNKN